LLSRSWKRREEFGKSETGEKEKETKVANDSGRLTKRLEGKPAIKEMHALFLQGVMSYGDGCVL
jgi:hypothetical protein